MKLNKGERQVVNLSGDVAQGQHGNFTVTVTKAGGGQVFRQSFAYTASGWTPQRPVKPANEPPVEELPLTAQYGPETNTVLVKADILDLPGREKVATAEAKVIEPETGKVLGSVPMRPFSEWYGGAELRSRTWRFPSRTSARPRRRQAARARPARKCRWWSSSATRTARS